MVRNNKKEFFIIVSKKFDRPNITVPILHAKLTDLLANLKYQKYFREKLVHEMRSIEYQHRGMPHTHIVLKLKEVPHDANGFVDSSWIDANLSDEMPTSHQSNNNTCM
jgi:hypothetical protein